MDINRLNGILPDKVLKELPEVINKYAINTPLRLGHFLAQAGHESGDFKVVNENLNYSADGLMKIFKKYFPTLESTVGYAKVPNKIANKVYANRMGNKDEPSEDGYRFRGRGYIQLTGKNNYSAFGLAINKDILNFPDKVANEYPLLSAAWFWNKTGLNVVADGGETDLTVIAVTKKVNGGTIGIEDRIEKFHKYYNLLK